MLRFVIILLVSLACHASDRLPKRKLKKLTVSNAVTVLNSATSNDYLSAVYWVVKSKLAKGEKEAALLKFFSNRKKLERMRKQGEGNSRDIYLGLSLVSKHLELPSEVILKLLKSELYNPTREDDHLSWELRKLTIVIVRDMPRPSKGLVTHIAKLPGKHVGFKRLAVIARHGDDALLEDILERTRKEPAEDQKRWYPEEMRSVCHRPSVFKYVVDSYLRFGYSIRLYRILTRDDDNFPKSYEKVLKKDVNAILKQVDRILKIKHVLLGLPDQNNRLDDEDVGDLAKLRKILTVKSKEKK